MTIREQHVLGINDIAGLRLLQPDHFAGRAITKKELRHIFELLDSFWIHSGDMRFPHVELTSGLHSNGFVNCRIPLSYPNLRKIFARQIEYQLGERDIKADDIDWIASSSYTAMPLGNTVADLVEAQFGYTEKGADKKQAWQGLTITPGETVVQVEDLNTTGGTIQQVRNAIPFDSSLCSFIMVLVDRSESVFSRGGPEIVLVAHYDITNYQPNKCPLCQAGSEALRPRQGDNWLRITQPEKFLTS